MCIKKITLFVTAVLMAFAACAGNVEVTRGSVAVRLDFERRAKKIQRGGICFCVCFLLTLQAFLIYLAQFHAKVLFY